MKGRVKARDGEIGPSVSCTVDGAVITPLVNNQLLQCEWSGEYGTDGARPHIFRIEVTIPQESNTDSQAEASFAVDTLQYLPAPHNGPLSDSKAIVIYNYDDPHIHLSPNNWKRVDLPVEAVMATELGPSATVLFTGKQISSLPK